VGLAIIAAEQLVLDIGWSWHTVIFTYCGWNIDYFSVRPLNFRTLSYSRPTSSTFFFSSYPVTPWARQEPLTAYGQSGNACG
jgi:hypothetical protein